MDAIGDVIIDGTRLSGGDAAISVFDVGLLRGYGCFEALRSYGGKPFRMREHLDRLESSARAMWIPVPDRGPLEAWVEDRALDGGDCVIRVVVTGGTSLRTPGIDGRVVVFAEAIPELPSTLRVLPTAAPWHPAGSTSELTGAKTLSYAPNIAAGLAAHEAGFDDALLMGRGGEVLEGPTYSVGWIEGGVLRTPALDLGILGSITRAATLEIAARVGVPVEQSTYGLAALHEADEVFAMSTVKEIMPITGVGDRIYPVGPLTQKLAAEYADLVRAEIGS